jgi:hypothetical protein
MPKDWGNHGRRVPHLDHCVRGHHELGASFYGTSGLRKYRGGSTRCWTPRPRSCGSALKLPGLQLPTRWTPRAEVDQATDKLDLDQGRHRRQSSS